MKFKFRLQKVLELRQQKEETCERELAELKRVLIQEEQFLVDLKEKSHEMRQRLDHLQDGEENALCMEELVRYADYLDHLQNRIVDQIRRVKKTVNDTDQKRDELVEASKEKKVIEKLKGQQLKRFRDSAAETERKRLDEIGMNNYSHRRKK
ncbi:MAG: flagellar export protein FliJ [Candidatus Omnitrophica bacterium]|nr:flagellar export protein FliJ [Candidatus Omnitrophota bacterium]